MFKKILITILFANQIVTYGQSSLINVLEEKIKTPYEETSNISKYRYDSISYEATRKQNDYIFESFKYKSDNLKIEGFLCRPRNVSNKKIPVIIYNRGGTGNFGKVTEEDFPDFYALAKEGFVVFASNYRYVGKNGFYDQLGGDDINDVVNLYKTLLKIDYVDTNNIFMFGISRGGLMTYKSLTKINVNAAVVIGGVANFEEGAKKRPIFLKGWSDLSEEENYKGLENILPNFDKKRVEYLKDRSAVEWAYRINTPIFILHSRQDGRVPVEGALQLALEFQKYDKPYKLKVYDKKSHSLPYSKFDSFNEAIKWFKSYMK
ncbi:prolyl oligopeptidase family serine peptidase [Pontimicrobium sp. SW4]|uniref:Prolyl oligopeptidase family serine peptidase n=1 Tax=Pontimicrobium sp. SW4 TaxID=3153519 RepID=A0AAU7BWX6_9FLAO